MDQTNKETLCRRLVDKMYCLLRPYVQKCRRVLTRIKLGHVLFCFGVIALLEFFGVFIHLFEVTYDKNFVYPYEGNIHDFVNALRRNEKPEIKPINEYKYAFILKQPQKCKEDADTLRLVYVVKSALENFDRRTAIRNSWGIEKRFFDVPARTIFVVGTHPDDEDMDARLKLEAAIYKDIIQVDFIDSYYNNTIKTMMGFKWLVKHCSNSKFYMFVDDDMYVSVKNVVTFIRNPANYPFYLMESRKIYSAHKREIKQFDLMNYKNVDNPTNGNPIYNSKINKISSMQSFTIYPSTNNNSEMNMYKKQDAENNESLITENEQLSQQSTSALNRMKRQLFDFELPDSVRLFAGFVFMRSAPHRHKFSKWYVSLREYPYHLWPPYVTAGAYILSKEALLDLYYTSFYTKHFRFDDIFLGLVAKKADIVPFHCEDFHFYKKPYTKYGYKYVITSHGYGDPNELLQIWNEQKALGNA